MPNSDPPDDSERRYEKFNALGWAAWLGGQAVRLAARGIDRSARGVARIAADTERAYRRGRDDGVDDAKIVEEWDDRDGGRQSADRRKR
jgi:hypothetical protein